MAAHSPVGTRQDALGRWIIITVILSLAHIADHMLRGDFNPALHPEAPLTIIIAIGGYLFIGAALYAQYRRWLGAKFWLMLGLAGILLAIVTHWLPSAEQNLSYIYHAYTSPMAGALAVAVFVALTLALVVSSVKAAYLIAKH